MNENAESLKSKSLSRRALDKPMEAWQILIEQGNRAQASKAMRQAEQIYKQAIAECQMQSTNKLDSLALCLLNLGHLYESQLRLEAAEGVFKSVLSIFEDIHGPRSLAVALILDRISAVCREQGKHIKARALSLRASSIYSAILNHQSVMTKAS